MVLDGFGLVGIAILIALVVLLVVLTRKRGTKVELHGYQIDFLMTMYKAGLPEVMKCSKEYNISGASAALQALVEEAVHDEDKQKEIFDTFHCVHCGSVKPAEWIAGRKGKKEPHSLQLTKMATEFLKMDLLVPVEKLGTPPVRQVVSGPRRADVSKAARCCVDWAIKAYGAVADGNVAAHADMDVGGPAARAKANPRVRKTRKAD